MTCYLAIKFSPIITYLFLIVSKYKNRKIYRFFCYTRCLQNKIWNNITKVTKYITYLLSIFIYWKNVWVENLNLLKLQIWINHRTFQSAKEAKYFVFKMARFILIGCCHQIKNNFENYLKTTQKPFPSLFRAPIHRKRIDSRQALALHWREQKWKSNGAEH